MDTAHGPLPAPGDDAVDTAALDRYLAEESPLDERARVERWAAANAERVRWLGTLRSAVAMAFGTMPVDATRAQGVLARRLGRTPRREASVRKGPRWGLWGGLTAVTAILLAIGLTSSWHPSTGTASWTTYVTADGQRARIELGDGTIVALNVASRLEVPEHFGRTYRTVRLSGEADFQVAHTAGVPFTVDAHGRRTTVLGTEFAVQAYGPDTVQVAVRSGRVMMDQTVLAAHDIARATGRGPVSVAHDQHLDAMLAFTTGHLLLNDAPLRDAIASLDRWYDVDVRLGDPALGDLPVSANLTSGSPGDLTDILQLMLGIRVVRSGRVLTLYQR